MKLASKTKKPYFVLIFLILISCLLIYHSCVFGNNFFMFGDIGSDTESQYLMWYSSIVDKIRAGTFCFWDFKNGFGASIAPESLYDPFQLLICGFGALFGASSIPYFLVYVNIFKIVLAGLSMYYFLNCFDLSDKVKIISSYMYAFNGFMIVWGQHYSFATIVVYLPLLFAAIEKSIFNRKKWIFLTIITAIIGIYSFYFLYMSLITAFIYCIFRILGNNYNIKECSKIFSRNFFAVLLGIGLACFSILPCLYVILNVSPRISSDVNILEAVASNFCFFNKGYYYMLICREFSSNLQGTTSFSGYINYYESLNFCCSNLFVFLAFQYIFSIFGKNIPKKERYKRSIIIFLLALAFFLKIGGFIYNGFAYSMCRWTFAVIPILILLSAKMLNEIVKLKKVSVAGAVCYFLLTFAVYIFAYKNISSSTQHQIKINIVILFSTAICVGVIILIYCFKKVNMSKKVLFLSLISIISVNMISDSHTSVNSRDLIKKDGDYISSVYNQNIASAVKYLRTIDPFFWRVEKTFTSGPLNMLDPLAQNYYGINTYNSLINKNILKFNQNIWKNIQKYAFSYQRFNDAKQDHIKASLVGLKYILSDNDEKINGFTNIARFGDIFVWKNDCEVAIGRFYTKAINKSSIEKNKYEDENVLREFEHESIIEKNGYNVDSILTDALILKNDEFNISDSDLDYYKSEHSNQELLDRFEKMPLVDFKIGENDEFLSGVANISRSGILLITVPYEGGWSAYVDDKKANILQAFYGFSALKLDPGKHKIELKFTPPWLWEGSMISLISLLFVIIILICQKFLINGTKNKDAST